MAQAQQPMNPQDNSILIKQALEDFGVPAQKIFQIYNVYESCTDYMKDVEKFKENYDKFQELKKAAEAVQDSANSVSQNVNALNHDILQKTSWFKVSKVDTDKMNAAEMTADEIKQNTEDLGKIFGSPAAATKQADEVLNRRNVLRIIQLCVVFKDVAFGIHKVINTARDIKYYNQRFQEINTVHIQPTIQSFDRNGTIDDDLVDRGLWKLGELKHSVENKQYETQQSIITHGLNAISTGLQAYATFSNINLLSGIASKSALTLNYFIGGAQAVLAVGSLALTGVETYNYMQYKTLIDDIEEMIKTLESYQKYKAKSK